MSLIVGHTKNHENRINEGIDMNDDSSQPEKQPNNSSVVVSLVVTVVILFCLYLLGLVKYEHVTFTILTLMLVLGLGVSLVMPLKWLNTRIQKKVDNFPNLKIICDGIVVAALVGIVIELPHIKSYFMKSLKEYVECPARYLSDINLEGKWNYYVENSLGKRTHEGIADISQQGCYVTVGGTRKKEIAPGKTEMKTVNKSWDTITGVLYGENYHPRLLFVYRIQDTTGEKKGAVNLRWDLNRAPINEMNGEYSQLAPHTLVGHIHFKKIKAISQQSAALDANSAALH